MHRNPGSIFENLRRATPISNIEVSDAQVDKPHRYVQVSYEVQTQVGVRKSALAELRLALNFRPELEALPPAKSNPNAILMEISKYVQHA